MATLHPSAVDSGLTPQALQGLDAALFGALAKPKFRGSITDYARTIELGSGYILPTGHVCLDCQRIGLAECRHFEIETCRQLAGPFAAILDPNVWLIMVEKATQTLGSMTWDMTLHFLIIHSRFMRIKVFIDNDEKARKYCDERLMDTLKRNPDIAPLLPTGGQARHDNSKTEIKFTNGKTIVVFGLNDSNASSLPGDFVIIDEAWVHKSDGLTKKAVDRTKQVGYRKVLVVGRAGKKDEDQDVLWKGLHKRVPCSWACPCCGSRQTFGERGPAILRPEDFVPVLPKNIERRAGELPFPPAAPKPKTYAGLKTYARPSDLNTPEEIKAAAAATVLECYHCGFEIPDTKPMRLALMKSYEQEYRVMGPHGLYTPPKFEVGFWNPDPVSVTVPFAQTMQAYIVAKKSHELGNIIPLEDFYMDRWAMAWDEDLIRVMRISVQESYDALKAWDEEWRRCLIVDNQHELQTQWGSAWAVSREGKCRQLWRGPLRGLGDANKEWKEQPDTVAGKQKELGIKDQWVFLDGAYMLHEVIDECAKHGHWGTIDGERLWLCWNVLRGSKWQDFSHAAEQNPKVRFAVSDPIEEYRTIGKFTISVQRFEFSALKCGDMAATMLKQKGREALMLPETDKPSNPLSWTAQTNSMKRETIQSKHSGMSSDIWLPLKQNTPTHYWDLVKMLNAVFCIWEIDGLFGAPVEETTVTATAPDGEN